MKEGGAYGSAIAMHVNCDTTEVIIRQPVGKFPHVYCITSNEWLTEEAAKKALRLPQLH